jgi:hypothetical protein
VLVGVGGDVDLKEGIEGADVVDGVADRDGARRRYQEGSYYWNRHDCC